MTKDMTSGSPLKLILMFSLPLLLGNLLQQTYNIIDAAIVGRYLGTQALAGVGASSSVQFLVLGFCIGTCNGFAIPIARDFGAGDLSRMRRVIFHALLMTLAIAVILTAVCVGFCPQILHLLSTPDDIYADAYSYLVIIFWGIPFTLLYNMLSSILRAVGDSRTPFVFLAFCACLNIVLDLLFIIVFGLGCAGASLATVTSQAISGLLCLFLILRKFQVLHLKREECRCIPSHFSELLVMGLPMGLQYSITAIGSMVMQSANNGLGSIYVSGFTAGSKIKQFMMCPFDAVATGMSVFCSQNMGAGKSDRIRQGMYQGIAVCVAYGAAAGLVLIFAGRTLSMLFVGSDSMQVLDASAKYLRCLGCFYYLLGILNTCRMCTQGLGHSLAATFSGVMEMCARTIVSFCLVPVFGFKAICFADQSAWIAACIYIVPTCYRTIRRVTEEIESRKRNGDVRT